MYQLPTHNQSSWVPLFRYTKTEISHDWMMGLNGYKNAKDCCTGKVIPQYATVFWKRDQYTKKGGEMITLDTYLTAIRNKKRCEKYLKKFEELGLPLDIDVGLHNK